MGTIQKRSNGTYTAKIRRKGFPALSRTFPTRGEGEAWLNEHEALIRTRVHEVKKEAERRRVASECAPQYRTLGDLMRRYLAVVTPLKRSSDQETLRMNGLLKHSLAECPLSSLSPQRVAEWRDLRLQSVSSSTVKRDMTVLAHVLKVASDEWGESFTKNPFRVVRRPKESAPRNRRLKAGEESGLLAACDDARAHYLRPVVELAIETAMRQSEIVSLAWTNISLPDRSAYLPMTKNGTSRDVPLSSRAIKILDALPAERDNAGNRTGFVFPSVTTEAVKRAFIRARNRAKLVDFRFHDLRHEATSRFFERKLTVPEVARITGHKTWTMLERYTHLRLEDVARRLDGTADATVDSLTLRQFTDDLRRLIDNAITPSAMDR
jgi:integrase